MRDLIMRMKRRKTKIQSWILHICSTIPIKVSSQTSSKIALCHPIITAILKKKQTLYTRNSKIKRTKCLLMRTRKCSTSRMMKVKRKMLKILAMICNSISTMRKTTVLMKAMKEGLRELRKRRKKMRMKMRIQERCEPSLIE